MKKVTGTILHLMRADKSIENTLATMRHPSDEIQNLSRQSDLRAFLGCTLSVNRVVVLSTPMDSGGNVIGKSSVFDTIALGESTVTDVQ